METTQLAACFLFALVFYGSPGPATLSLSTSGAAIGFRRSLPYLAGIVFGLGINFLVAMLGIVILLERAPGLVAIMKYASLVYIVYLATKMMGMAPAGAEVRPLGFGEGLLLNLLNPKAYVASLAVISQFGAAEPRATWLIFLVVLGTGLFVDIAWCYSGAMVGRVLASSRRLQWIRAILSGIAVASVLVATFGS